MFPPGYFAETYFSEDYWPPIIEIEHPPQTGGGDTITRRTGPAIDRRKRLILGALLNYGEIL